MSRHHAVLNWDVDTLSLIDNGSKFGTLVQLKGPQNLDPENLFAIQCGRTLLELTVEKSWSLFSCFGAKHNRSKTKGENKEENKTPPNECLPGDGRHSVLVIKKKAYNKLLNIGSTPKVKKPIKLEDRDSTSLMSCKTPPQELTESVKLRSQKTMAFNMAPRSIIRSPETFAIKFHHGDTADDVKPEDL